MDIFRSYAVDETKEVEGSWFPVGDAEYLVARSGNMKYSKMLTKLFEVNRKALELGGEAADTLSQKLMTDILSETILLGWRGNVTFKGAELPYTKENAKMVLAIKDFRSLILKFADDFDAFKAKEEAEQEKN